MPSAAKTFKSHAAKRARAARNLGDHQGMYSYAWQKASRTYLRRHPLCRACTYAGRHTAATVVDHIIPHKGDRDRFWDSDNWQPLCKQCHDRKTVLEDGGFGR